MIGSILKMVPSYLADNLLLILLDKQKFNGIDDHVKGASVGRFAVISCWPMIS